MSFKTVCSTLFLLVLSVLSGITQVSSPDFDIQKLAPGVYAAIHKPGGRAICNAGIIDLGDETLVIDPFISPYAAEELKRVIAAMGLGPVRYVVNTHFHNDHVRGNQAFDEADIYSTQKSRDLMEEYEPEEIAYEQKVLPDRIAKSDSTLAATPLTDIMQRKQVEFWNSYYKTILESHEILETRLPDKIIVGEEIIKGSELSVKLIDLGEGHTGSDLICYIPSRKIIFTGDVLFIQNHPWIADGNPDSLRNTLNKIKTMKASVLVPGHGPVGKKKDIDTFLLYLDDISEVATDLVNQNVALDQITDLPIPPAYQNWLLARFYVPNVKFTMEAMMAKMK